MIKQALIDELDVPEREVRICTGSIDEIGDTDLMDSNCQIRYIITVDKLREGWDCPWAYVLGSIGNTATATSVEQLIGRILRMPNATPTRVPALDRAYAFVLSENVIATAQKLRDKMVETCGFDERSAADALRVRVTQSQPGLGFSRIPMSQSPDLKSIPSSLARKVHWEESTNTLVMDDLPSAGELLQLQKAVESEDDKRAIDDFWIDQRPLGITQKLPGEFAKPFHLPSLVVRIDRRRVLLEPIELEQFEWDLDSCHSDLSESDFPSDIGVGQSASIDIESRGGDEAGLVTYATGEVRLRQLELIGDGGDWSVADLVRWLDREIHRGDSLQGLPKSLSQPWLLKVVDGLAKQRKLSRPMVVRRRHELAALIRTMITDHGRKQMRKATELLIREQPDSIQTDVDFSINIEEDQYNPTREYTGNHRFQKHAFSLIGTMNGEEIECATRIDGHRNVKRWLRNLEHETQGGFSLPKSPGRFFPDFIAELMDGRIVLIEYKGGNLAHDPEQLHKRDIGELWAQRSDAGHRFGWVVDKDWQALETSLKA